MVKEEDFIQLLLRETMQGVEQGPPATELEEFYWHQEQNKKLQSFLLNAHFKYLKGFFIKELGCIRFNWKDRDLDVPLNIQLGQLLSQLKTGHILNLHERDHQEAWELGRMVFGAPHEFLLVKDFQFFYWIGCEKSGKKMIEELMKSPRSNLSAA